MVSNPSSVQVDEISYGGAIGWVRLVSDGWTTEQKREIRRKAILDICGLSDDYIIDEDLGIIIDPKDTPIEWDSKFTPPKGWRVGNDLLKYHKVGLFYLNESYYVGPGYEFGFKSTSEVGAYGYVNGKSFSFFLFNVHEDYGIYIISMNEDLNNLHTPFDDIKKKRCEYMGVSDDEPKKYNGPIYVK